MPAPAGDSGAWPCSESRSSKTDERAAYETGGGPDAETAEAGVANCNELLERTGGTAIARADEERAGGAVAAALLLPGTARLWLRVGSGGAVACELVRAPLPLGMGAVRERAMLSMALADGARAKLLPAGAVPIDDEDGERRPTKPASFDGTGGGRRSANCPRYLATMKRSSSLRAGSQHIAQDGRWTCGGSLVRSGCPGTSQSLCQMRAPRQER
jgi:hypothetical protein